MPQISFVDLSKAIQADYRERGLPLSRGKADLLADSALNDAYFKQWLAQVDEYDAERGLTDLDGHTDTTARTAIKRVLRVMFQQTQAVAA